MLCGKANTWAMLFSSDGKLDVKVVKWMFGQVAQEKKN